MYAKAPQEMQFAPVRSTEPGVSNEQGGQAQSTILSSIEQGGQAQSTIPRHEDTEVNIYQKLTPPKSLTAQGLGGEPTQSTQELW